MYSEHTLSLMHLSCDIVRSLKAVRSEVKSMLETNYFSNIDFTSLPTAFKLNVKIKLLIKVSRLPSIATSALQLSSLV